MTSYEFTIGEALKALDLVREIAALKRDGEPDDDGGEFVMENDDAWETIHSLIGAARVITRHEEAATHMNTQELILGRIEAEIPDDLLLVNDRQYANTGTLRTMRRASLERVASVTYDFQVNRCHFGPISARVAALWYDAEPRDGEADWVCHSIPELVNTVVIALRGEL